MPFKKLRYFAAQVLLLFVSASSFAGTAENGIFHYSVNLGIPSGTSGVAPKLSLSYDSSTEAAGLLGKGWSLSGLPTISRLNRDRPLGFDGNDEYQGPGGRLVDVSNGERREFHHESENWDRIIPDYSCRNDSLKEPCSWLLRDALGNTLFFGDSSDSVVLMRDEKGRPRFDQKPLTWALRKFEDAHGFSYVVDYESNPGSSDLRVKSIQYTLGRNLKKFRRIDFHYGDRPDVVTQYGFGQIIREQKRLKSVAVYSEDSLVRRYDLCYLGEPCSDRPLTSSKRSLLASIQEFGSDGVSALPATEFTWTEQGPAFKFEAESTGQIIDQTTLKSTKPQVLDWNGDGFSDVVRLSSTGLYLQENLRGNGFKSTYKPFRNLKFDLTQVQDLVGDMNVDGKDEVVRLSAAGAYIFRAGPDGDLVSSFVANPRNLPTAVLSAPGALLDVNGDALPDIIRIGNRSIFQLINDGKGNYTSSELEFGNLSTLQNKLERLVVADLNVDGKVDFALMGENSLYIWLCDGRSGYTFQSWPYLDQNGQPRTLNLQSKYTSDINGDGRADIVMVSGQSVTTLLNTGFGHFKVMGQSNPSNWSSFAPTTAVIVEDRNRDGLSDILRITKTGIFVLLSNGDGTYTPEYTSIPQAFHLDDSIGQTVGGEFRGDGSNSIYRFTTSSIYKIHGGAIPELLSGIHESNGGNTRIIYQSSLLFPNAVQPDATSCGGGTQTGYNSECGIANRQSEMLVSKVISSDGRGQSYETSYDYFNSRLRVGADREVGSLGFEMVRELGPSGQYTESWFSQRKYFIGSILKMISFSEAGRAMNVTEQGYRILGDCKAQGCEFDVAVRPLLIVQTSEKTETFEPSDGRFLFGSMNDFTHTNYGALESDTKHLIDRNREKVFVQKGLKFYINDYDRGIVSLPYRDKTCKDSSCNEIRIERTTYYDDLDVGQAGALRRATKTETKVLDRTDTTEAAYDEYDNMIWSRGADGIERRVEYDPDFHLFIWKDYNTSGYPIITSYDFRYGTPIQVIEPNGLVFETKVDVFGRSYETYTHEKDSDTVLSRSMHEFSLGNSAEDQNWIMTCNSIKDQKICSTNYVDGLGRTYKTRSQGQKGWVYTEFKFNSKGQEVASSLPYYEGDAVYWNAKEYDSAGRLVLARSANGKSQTQYFYNNVEPIEGSVSSEMVQDSLGRKKVKWQNLYGQVIQQTEAYGTDDAATTLYRYNENLQQEKIISPDQKTMFFVFDKYGRIVEKHHPDLGVYKYTFNDVPGRTDYGKTATETFPDPMDPTKTITKVFSYDASGRTKGFVSSDGSSMTYDYDERTKNSIERITRTEYVQNGITIEKEFGFNIRGFAERTYVNISESDGTKHEFTTSTERDALDRVVRINHPNGISVVTCFVDSYLTPTETRLDNCENGQLIARYGERNAAGHLLGATLGNGVESKVGYEPSDNSLRSIHTAKDGTILFNQNYDYDGMGNLVSIEDNYIGKLSAADFQYDSLDRLRFVKIGDRSFRYDYDAAGDLTNKNGVVQKFNERHQILSSGDRSFDWTTAGVLVRAEEDGKTKSFDYNGESRLSSFAIDGNIRAKYFYDVDGRRILKIAFDPGSDKFTKSYYLTESYEYNEQWKGPVKLGCQSSLLVEAGGQKIARYSTAKCPNASLGGVGPETFHNEMSKLYHWSNPMGAALKSFHLLARTLESKPVEVLLSSLPLILGLGLMLWMTLYYAARTNLRKRWGYSLTLSFLAAQFFLTSCGFHSSDNVARLRSSFDAVESVGTSLLPEGLYFYSSNYLGSVALVTDSKGEEVERINYLPFGEQDEQFSGRYKPESGTFESTGWASKHRYTGQEKDGESGLYYYGARYYAPELGVFTSADRVTPGDGTIALGFNRYLYVAGNPFKFTDPSGHSWLSKKLKKIGKKLDPSTKSWWKKSGLRISDQSVLAKVWNASLQYTVVGAYRNYQQGGWKAVAAGTVSAVANAFLFVYTGGTVSVSLSYSYKGGWTYGVGLGNGIVSAGIYHNEKTGNSASFGLGYTHNNVSGGLSVQVGRGKPVYSANVSMTINDDKADSGQFIKAYQNDPKTTLGAGVSMQAGSSRVSSDAYVRHSNTDFTAESLAKHIRQSRMVYEPATKRFYSPGYTDNMASLGVLGGMEGSLSGFALPTTIAGNMIDSLFGMIGVPSPRYTNDVQFVSSTAAFFGLSEVNIVAHSNGNFVVGTILRYGGLEQKANILALDPPMTLFLDAKFADPASYSNTAGVCARFSDVAVYGDLWDSRLVTGRWIGMSNARDASHSALELINNNDDAKGWMRKHGGWMF